MSVIVHDEDRAAAEAAEVLSLLYVQHDYERAYARLHTDFRARARKEDLETLVTRVEGQYGSTQQFRRESFLPIAGQRAITIFLTAQSERGLTYHRVMVLGDAANYRVGGLFVQGQPYPPESLRQPLREVAAAR